jgi:hypothetical protein
MKYLFCFTSLLSGLAIAACAGTPRKPDTSLKAQSSAPINLASATAPKAAASPVAAAKTTQTGTAWQTLATGGVMRIHALGDGVYLTSGFNIGELKADGLTWRPELERGLPRGDHSMYSQPAFLNLHGAFGQRVLATSTRASGAPSTFGPEATRYYWSNGTWQFNRPGAAGFSNLENYATSGMNEEAIAEFPLGAERVRLMTTYPNGTSDGLDTQLIDRNLAHCKQHPARYVGMSGALSAAARAALPAIPTGYRVVDFRAYEGAGYMLVLEGDRGVRVDVIDQNKVKSYRAEQPTKRVEISGYPIVKISAFGEFSVEGEFSSHDMQGTQPPGSKFAVHFEVKNAVQRDVPIRQAIPEPDEAETAAAKLQVLQAALANRKELSTRIEGRVWGTTPYRKLANYYVSHGSLYDAQGKYVAIQLDAAGTAWLSQADAGAPPSSEDELAQRTSQLAVQDAYELGDLVFVSLSVPVATSYGSADGLLAAFKRTPGPASLAVKGEHGAMTERAVPRVTLRVINGSYNVTGPLVCAHENAIVPVRIVATAREAEAVRELAAKEKGTEACEVEVVRSGGQTYLYQSGGSGPGLSFIPELQMNSTQSAYCLPMTGDIRYSISAGKSSLLPPPAKP